MVAPILIDGEWISPHSQSTLAITNPATLEPLGKIANCDAVDVDRAVQAAKRAQPNWWKTPGLEKANLLKQVADGIKARERELAHLLCQETGKPLWESTDCIEWVVACFEYYAELGRSSRGNSIPPVAPHQVNFTIKEPYGVVAAIVPFNFPLLLMAWKVAPALAAGNTVVCKPPHQNPLSNLLMAQAYDVLPPGVVNVITGSGDPTGAALVEHPDVNLIAFTGSTAVGRQIASVAGQHLKKLNLELGGVDPFIVFPDADLDVAVPGVVWARLLNAGQVCTSSKRIYIVEPLYETFVERVVAYVQTLKIGDPRRPEVDLGPLISETALLKVADQVERAVAEGAILRYGGQRCSDLPGYFYQPTVLEVKHGSLATREEIFGPVLSVIRAPDPDTAIAMANDSLYGLGACIYTRSLEYTMKAMENIKAGSFWVNDPLTDNEAAPFGGMRWSGIGRELGAEGLEAFWEPKHVHIDYLMERKPYWYPYQDRGIPH
jgi:acyl-CoA reductase-like NAD-dependent aldehyde dehydrogenase